MLSPIVGYICFNLGLVLGCRAPSCQMSQISGCLWSVSPDNGKSLRRGNSRDILTGWNRTCCWCLTLGPVILADKTGDDIRLGLIRKAELGTIGTGDVDRHCPLTTLP
jgi:hypothetical protein